jgi:uncharacterized membrane protein
LEYEGKTANKFRHVWKTIGKIRSASLDSLERSLSIRFLGRERAELLLYLSIVVYTVAFSWHMIVQYLAFHTFAWDLGIYNQAMWTTAHQGRLFYYTCELYFVPNGSFFGIHFAPILFFIVPIYALFSGPETLLVIQSFVLALGAVPLYLLAKQNINRVSAIVFSLCYLLNPLLHGVNSYDFHVEAFFPLFMLLSLFYLEKKNWLRFFASLVLSLMVMEQISYIVAFLGFYVLWTFRGRILSAIRAHRIDIRSIAVPLLTFALGISWFFFSQFIIGTINPHPPPELIAGQNFAVLGVNDPKNIPLYVLLHPDKAWNALTFDFYSKFSYLVFAFAPLMFLSILSPVVLIGALPWFGLILVSSYPPYYQMGFQYSALIIPFIFVSAILGMAKVVNVDSNGRTAKKILTLVMISSIIFCIAFSPLSPLIQGGYPSPAYVAPEITDHARLLNTFVNLVPQNASILTQDNIFPHVSNRANAYVIMPQIQGDTPTWEKAAAFISSLETTYVLIDLKSDPSIGMILLSHVIQEGTYGLYASADRILLFKQFYVGEPVLYQPILVEYDFRNLVNDGKIVDDPTSKSGEVLYHDATSGQGTFWYGPYDALPSGTYNVTFSLKVSSLINEHVVTLDVRTQGRTLASEDINGSDFHTANSWQNFTLQFELNKTVVDIEFRGTNVSNATNISLDYIQVAALPNG